MKILRSKLYEHELEKKREISRKLEDTKLDIDFGSQIRSYVLHPYRLVKDHRTKMEIADLDPLLDRNLPSLIRAYLTARINYEQELEKKREISRKLEDTKLDIDFGSQIRSYVLHPYRLVKDHRTKMEIGDVDRVLDGDLKSLIRAYLTARRNQG